MSLKGRTIGVPREIMPGEDRVAATPETVKRLVEMGARVCVEAGAGLGSFHPDEAYAAVGAEVVAGADEIYATADILLKVKEPRADASGAHEIDRMREGQVLIGFLHPASPGNHAMVRKLAARGVKAFTLDGIPRMAKTQPMDALSSMSMVAGYKGMLMAADALAKFVPLAGSAVGVVPPASLLVVGAGVAGLQAAATGKRLGATVAAADIRPEAREQAGSLGATVIDPGVPADAAVGEGGYARELSREWLEREREALRPKVEAADIVVLSALVPGRVSPVLVTAPTVRAMRPGSVIVDIAVDQGGNCEVTAPGETVLRHGVTVVGIQNIPGRVPATATLLFARNVLNFLLHLDGTGSVEAATDDEVASSARVTWEGRVVHAGALDAMKASAEGGA